MTEQSKKIDDSTEALAVIYEMAKGEEGLKLSSHIRNLEKIRDAATVAKQLNVALQAEKLIGQVHNFYVQQINKKEEIWLMDGNDSAKAMEQIASEFERQPKLLSDLKKIMSPSSLNVIDMEEKNGILQMKDTDNDKKKNREK